MPTNFEAIGVVFIVKSVVMRGQEKQEEEEQKYAGLGTSLEHMTSRNSLLLASRNSLLLPFCTMTTTR